MKIIRLEAANVKRLKAVEITPAGNVVEIRGRNAQGKSSCLDAIAMALGGKSVAPPKVIRDGEEEAHVVLDLDDLVVTRRWTSNDKSYLDVRTKDGAKVASPQAALDKLVGSLSFDPLAFLRYEPKKQLELLRTLTGVDYSDLEAEYRKTYEERTVVNRELDRARARIPSPVEAPDAEVSMADLLAEQEQLQAQAQANRSAREQLEQAKRAEGIAKADAAHAAQRVTELERQLADAKKLAQHGADEASMAAASVEALQADVDELPADPDLSDVRRRMGEVEATNAKVRQKKERARLAAEASAKQKEADALTKRIDALKAEKEKRIAAASMPVDGLGFGADGITYRGLPFEQASSAEQLRVSLAMGLALNPKLKVLLIRDGSLLDEDSMRVVAEMAEKADAQVWLELVASGGSGIVIEDGQIAST